MPAPRLVSDAQLEKLVEYMEENRAFALGRPSLPPMEMQHLTQRWEELTTTLNSIAGATKTAKRWREYWSEKKYGVRKKATQLQSRRTERKTATTWTPLDIRIVNILGKVLVRGNPSMKILIKSQPPTQHATLPATLPVAESATEPAAEPGEEPGTEAATEPATKPVVIPQSPLSSAASTPRALKYSKISASNGCKPAASPAPHSSPYSLPACIQSIESNTAATKLLMEATQRSAEATQRSIEAIQTSAEATQRSMARIEMLLENVLARWIP